MVVLQERLAVLHVDVIQPAPGVLAAVDAGRSEAEGGLPLRAVRS